MSKYFDFSANDDRIFIPRARKPKLNQKGGFVNRNFISSIKSAPSLDKYAELTDKKEGK
ncbi:MAG: hypothetical protein IJ272_05900 [Clostridia bacterium]|nr:hypothetical protein [Clostridia bacterium]